MKRKWTLSLLLALIVLVSLVSLPASAQGEQRQRFTFDHGVVTPAAGQTLRVTVAGGKDTIRARFTWIQYAATGCSGAPSVCRHMVVTQGATPVETLGPDDALSFDFQGSGAGVRVLVESTSRDARVKAMIINPDGNTTALCTSHEYKVFIGGGAATGALIQQ